MHFEVVNLPISYPCQALPYFSYSIPSIQARFTFSVHQGSVCKQLLSQGPKYLNLKVSSSVPAKLTSILSLMNDS